MKLFLVRHGLVNYDTRELCSDGKKFAEKLIDIIPESNIDYICSDDASRCMDTVSPLASKLGLEVDPFTKEDFESKKPLKSALQHNCSVICYRIESINPILNKLCLLQFDDYNRDKSYEFIYYLQIENEVPIKTCKICTEFKKSTTGVVLFVKNLEDMMTFYRKVLGLKIDRDGDGPFKYEGIRIAMYERAKLPELLCREPGYPNGINGNFELAINVGARENVDAFFERVTRQGATIIYAPRDEPWKMRSAMVADPEGNLIEIASDFWE